MYTEFFDEFGKSAELKVDKPDFSVFMQLKKASDSEFDVYEIELQDGKVGIPPFGAECVIDAVAELKPDLRRSSLYMLNFKDHFLKCLAPAGAILIGDNDENS